MPRHSHLKLDLFHSTQKDTIYMIMILFENWSTQWAKVWSYQADDSASLQAPPQDLRLIPRIRTVAVIHFNCLALQSFVRSVTPSVKKAIVACSMMLLRMTVPSAFVLLQRLLFMDSSYFVCGPGRG